MKPARRCCDASRPTRDAAIVVDGELADVASTYPFSKNANEKIAFFEAGGILIEPDNNLASVRIISVYIVALFEQTYVTVF